MHGWIDPLDPDRPYRRPEPVDDQPSPPHGGPEAQDDPRPYGDPTDPYAAYGQPADPFPAGGSPYPPPAYGGPYPPPAGGSPYPPPAYTGPYPTGDQPTSSVFPMPGPAAAAGERRHRDPRPARRRLSRPVVLSGAAAAAALAVMVGVGAALLPPGADDKPRPTAAQDAPVPGGATDIAGTEAPPTAEPTDPATATTPPVRPSPSARAAPAESPSRRSAPTARRTATKRPTMKPTRTATPRAGNGSQAQRVVELVNQQRGANGCAPLIVNSKLTTAAQLHTEDQASHKNMSHTGSDGSTFDQRIRRAGYSGNALGENVAMGYPTAEAVMDGWMNSPGHRANILNCQFKAIGVGVAPDSGGRLYWTQDFGSTP